MIHYAYLLSSFFLDIGVLAFEHGPSTILLILQGPEALKKADGIHSSQNEDPKQYRPYSFSRIDMMQQNKSLPLHTLRLAIYS